MTDEELQRLYKLDNIIAWNNKTDGGRSLTEDEQQEHNVLMVKLLKEHEERK